MSDLIEIPRVEGEESTADGEFVCRLCSGHGVELMEICKIEGMSEKLHNFLQIEVLSNDPWPLVICPACVEKIHTWEAYYELVQRNEERLQATRVDTGTATVLYEMQTMEGVVKGEGEGDETTTTTVASYAVVCIPKMEGIPTAEQQVMEAELVDDWTNDVATEVDASFALHVEDNEDEEGEGEEEEVEEEETETVQVDGEEIEEEEEWKLEEIPSQQLQRDQNNSSSSSSSSSSPGGNKKRASAGSGKKKRSLTSFDYLTQRDKQDELIRQTTSLECEACSETADTFEDLISHYKTMHDNAQGYVRCCQKIFKRRYVLLEHARLHQNPDHYACPKCQKRFTTKRHLMDHEMLHIPEEQRKFPCQKCFKRYATNSRLQIHMKTHNDDLTFQCGYCAKTFKQEVILKNHIKTVHEGSNLHICEICAKVFRTKEGFQLHQVTHLETPPERLKCEICGGKYKNKDSLKYHMMRHRRAHERHYCDICNKEFTSKKRMSAHKKYVHASESELFACTMCDKTFKRPIYLKEHMAAHTGQLLYSCAYCPRQFNSNANKYSHQKAQHPEEWKMAREMKLAA